VVLLCVDASGYAALRIGLVVRLLRYASSSNTVAIAVACLSDSSRAGSSVINSLILIMSPASSLPVSTHTTHRTLPQLPTSHSVRSPWIWGGFPRPPRHEGADESTPHRLIRSTSQPSQHRRDVASPLVLPKRTRMSSPRSLRVRPTFATQKPSGMACSTMTLRCAGSASLQFCATDSTS